MDRVTTPAPASAQAKRSSVHNGRRPPGPAARALPAFTLVELLVVIGIIAVLISILLPTLSKARERANEIACSSNQRQIMQGFLMFANDYKGHLPGNYWDSAVEHPKNPERHDWLLGSNRQFADGPQQGTIFSYVNNNYGIYKCPSQIDDQVSIGFGSNGRYDYAAFIVFSGAKISTIKPKARFLHADGRVEDAFTPIVCEEEPQGGINGGNNEGGHCNTDRLGHVHRGGGYYVTIDTSVHWFKEPKELNSWAWWSKSPNGWTRLGHVVNWGWWNKQQGEAAPWPS